MATTEAEYLAQWNDFQVTGERWPPINNLMGLEMVRLSPTTILSMQLTDDVRGSMPGTIHGGILATFADTTMAVALWNAFEAETEVPVTTDMHIRYYRQPSAGPLRAEANVVHRGRRILSSECAVTDVDDRVLTRSTATYMIVPLPGSTGE